MPENKVQISIEAYNNATGALAELKRSFKDLESNAKTSISGIKGAFDDLTNTWLETTAKIYVAYRTLRTAFSFVELGAQAEQAKESFHTVASSMGYDAEDLLKKMHVAAHGLVDDSDMMQKAVKSMFLDIKPDEIVKLIEISRVAARTAGTDMGTAFETIIDAVATKMPRTLKRMGLVSKEELKAMEDAAREGKKEIELLNIVLQNGQRQMEVYGEITDSTADKIQKLKVIWKESKENIGIGIVDIITLVKDLWKTVGLTIELIFAKGVQGMLYISLRAEGALNTLGAISDARLKKSKEEYEKLKVGIGDLKKEIDEIYHPGEKKIPSPLPDKKAGPDLNKGSEDLKKLADEYAKLKAELEKEIALVGLEGFEKKLKEIELMMPELVKKFGQKKANVIFELSLELINKEEIQRQIDELTKSYMSDEDKIIAKAKESAQQQDDARSWLTDQIDKATLEEFDYQRATLLKEYEERATILGWTEELYQTFKGNLKKIDDAEVDQKRETLRQIRDLELQNQLAVIDIKEKTFQISEGEAIQKRIEIENEYLQKLDEEYKATIGIDAKREEGLKLLVLMRDKQKEIVDLQLRQEELSGSIADGWRRGVQEFTKEMPTSFQSGVDLAKTSFKELQDTLSNISFDAIKGKFQGWHDYVISLCDSINKKILDMMSQWLLFGQGGNGSLGGLFGLIFGNSGAAGTGGNKGVGWIGEGLHMHTGGIIPTERHFVPRFHFGGLNDDERMTIMKVGERAISEEQNTWITNLVDAVKGNRNAVSVTPPGMEVNITVNNKGMPVTAKQTGGGEIKFDGRKYIKHITLDLVMTDPEYKYAMKSGLG